MTTIEKSIEVDVPVPVAYNQWTQFEEFPQFMEGVEEVRQLDAKRLHWKASILGVTREWDAEIVHQTPDQQIAWRAVGGTQNDGVVMFLADPMNTTRTGSGCGWSSSQRASWRRRATPCTSWSDGCRATSSGSRSSSRAATSRPAAGAAR